MLHPRPLCPIGELPQWEHRDPRTIYSNAVQNPLAMRTIFKHFVQDKPASVKLPI
ncbi:hypothetical protein CLF_103236 [Clonorchis sinensis]|uniref:Uncharacterized protein n=1 Tax=Clonorchis sinensis TaxID=79923 RepID=G7Y9D2_CLOSI|nr:hypothetical protein CLF_103236 [Clonorchis sinensis]